jgi:hypothetical protein
MPASPRPPSVARMGYAPGERLSARLVSRGGPQRLPRATASQSARLTKTAVQGVDGIAQLRRARGGWYDTSLALFQATVPGALRNRVSLYRGPASTTEAKTPICSMSLKSLGVPPYVDTRLFVSSCRSSPLPRVVADPTQPVLEPANAPVCSAPDHQARGPGAFVKPVPDAGQQGCPGAANHRH